MSRTCPLWLSRTLQVKWRCERVPGVRWRCERTRARSQRPWLVQQFASLLHETDLRLGSHVTDPSRGRGHARDPCPCPGPGPGPCPSPACRGPCRGSGSGSGCAASCARLSRRQLCRPALSASSLGSSLGSCPCQSGRDGRGGASGVARRSGAVDLGWKEALLSVQCPALGD